MEVKNQPRPPLTPYDEGSGGDASSRDPKYHLSLGYEGIPNLLGLGTWGVGPTAHSGSTGRLVLHFPVPWTSNKIFANITGGLGVPALATQGTLQGTTPDGSAWESNITPGWNLGLELLAKPDPFQFKEVAIFTGAQVSRQNLASDVGTVMVEQRFDANCDERFGRRACDRQTTETAPSGLKGLFNPDTEIPGDPQGGAIWTIGGTLRAVHSIKMGAASIDLSASYQLLYNFVRPNQTFAFDFFSHNFLLGVAFGWDIDRELPVVPVDVNPPVLPPVALPPAVISSPLAPAPVGLPADTVPAPVAPAPAVPVVEPAPVKPADVNEASAAPEVIVASPADSGAVPITRPVMGPFLPPEPVPEPVPAPLSPVAAEAIIAQPENVPPKVVLPEVVNDNPGFFDMHHDLKSNIYTAHGESLAKNGLLPHAQATTHGQAFVFQKPKYEASKIRKAALKPDFNGLSSTILRASFTGTMDGREYLYAEMVIGGQTIPVLFYVNEYKPRHTLNPLAQVHVYWETDEPEKTPRSPDKPEKTEETPEAIKAKVKKFLELHVEKVKTEVIKISELDLEKDALFGMYLTRVLENAALIKFLVIHQAYDPDSGYFIAEYALEVRDEMPIKPTEFMNDLMIKLAYQTLGEDELVKKPIDLDLSPPELAPDPTPTTPPQPLRRPVRGSAAPSVSPSP